MRINIRNIANTFINLGLSISKGTYNIIIYVFNIGITREYPGTHIIYLEQGVHILQPVYVL